VGNLSGVSTHSLDLPVSVFGAMHRLTVPILLVALAGCPKHEVPAECSSAPDCGVVTASADAGVVSEDRAADRESMVRQQLQARGIEDGAVLSAMRKVPRHRFVPRALHGEAYADRPLPIGSGQTISQPYIVAFMTQAAKIKAGDRCLEIGTGSGYQAAVLAELCARTHSIEYLPDVARYGAANLRATGYAPPRVVLRVGDGYQGWLKAAPFDVILVTAAPDHVPRALLDQLAPGGRLVIPIGPGSDQNLERWTRLRPGADDAAFHRERLLGVRFVPFLGDAVRQKR